ncbi:MAG: hypothetical protein JXM79_00735 [Sedimentisphaerales bacterium]|nr:hypothetical protein [Sedimentisphaerales bacterium]
MIDSLEITPHVYADGSIGLDTTVALGAKNTPDGVLQTPIISRKEITNKGSRIREGESLIVGGIRKTEDYAVIRGVPLLKDLPLVGFLFSGEDVEPRAVETVFILTSTISSGGRTKQDLMRDIQRKHEASSGFELGSFMSDPLDFKAREKAGNMKH